MRAEGRSLKRSSRRDGPFVVEPLDLELKDGISYDNIKDLLYPSDLDTLKYRG